MQDRAGTDGRPTFCTPTVRRSTLGLEISCSEGFLNLPPVDLLVPQEHGNSQPLGHSLNQGDRTTCAMCNLGLQLYDGRSTSRHQVHDSLPSSRFRDLHIFTGSRPGRAVSRRWRHQRRISSWFSYRPKIRLDIRRTTDAVLVGFFAFPNSHNVVLSFCSTSSLECRYPPGSFHDDRGSRFCFRPPLRSPQYV